MLRNDVICGRMTHLKSDYDGYYWMGSGKTGKPLNTLGWATAECQRKHTGFGTTYVAIQPMSGDFLFIPAGTGQTTLCMSEENLASEPKSAGTHGKRYKCDNTHKVTEQLFERVLQACCNPENMYSIYDTMSQFKTPSLYCNHLHPGCHGFGDQ